ncbi:aminotransferase class V-fold PLP-dependent enzyme [uncultured Marivirga sp.]|uniref:aminotransferase class V-fold PLP-dependent enzyme n=1 Tax=uncultured Marivirga sp. TaxID=1123707 RepID=UPI0030EE196A|tara:strand:+ start:177944 stop:179008 length:1065 start_codon:yes stop_codon:yes gene_type:complete
MKYNFYPGPSKIYPQVARYFQEGMDLGIFERNHRSDSFQELFSRTKLLLKSKLNIPLDYEIAMVSSATECWEIIAQSFVQKRSSHYFNGAFGEKWWKYSQKIHPKSIGANFSVNELPQIESFGQKPELIALTHNETSNGTAIPLGFQKDIRKRFPDSMIAFDATSSMAGYEFDWENGDIWYASVQKCFGLPAGMAIMVVSPKAITRAKEIGDEAHYNSFNLILENTRKDQTHHTPNISNIFLLGRLLENVENITAIHNNLKSRKKDFYTDLKKVEILKPLINSSEVQSDTVFCLQGPQESIRMVIQTALNEGIILGNGYGVMKDSTIRVANFPAIPNQDYKDLINFLLRFEIKN